MEDTYRDPLAGLREAIERKRAQAEQASRSLSPLARSMLHPDAKVELGGWEERCRQDASGLEAMTELERAFDGWIAAIERAAAMAPDLARVHPTLPEPPAPVMGPPWLIEEPWLVQLREGVKAAVRSLDAAAKWERWGDFGYRAAFTSGGVPLVYRFTCVDVERNRKTYHHWLGTSGPAGYPKLRVKTEGIVEKVGKALSFRREPELGVRAWDDAFFVDGPEDFARALLREDARRHLGGLYYHDPVLEIGPGELVVTWTEKDLVEAHVALLAALRVAA